jgi:hypothetical protein
LFQQRRVELLAGVVFGALSAGEGLLSLLAQAGLGGSCSLIMRRIATGPETISSLASKGVLPVSNSESTTPRL